MRNLAVLLTLLLAITACRREEAAKPATSSAPTATAPADMKNAAVTASVTMEPVYAERSFLGTTLGKDGHVAEERTTFKRREKVHLTMWVKDSPAGLQTGALWYDDAGNKIHEERRPMNGSKVVTFAFVNKRGPGKYRVEALWGGNKAAEHEFEIEK